MPYLPRLLALWLCAFAVTNAVRMSSSPEDRRVADVVGFVKAVSQSGDEIFLWGAPSTIAFESDHPFATRFPFNNYLTGRIFGTDHSLPGATRAGNRALESTEGWRLLAADLATNRPAVIVDGRVPDFELGRYPLLRDYLLRFNVEALVTVDSNLAYQQTVTGEAALVSRPCASASATGARCACDRGT